MVGGYIKEISPIGGGRIPGKRKVSFTVGGTGVESNDQIKVNGYIRVTDYPNVDIGDSIWWQGKTIFIGMNDDKYEKVGYSYEHKHLNNG